MSYSFNPFTCNFDLAGTASFWKDPVADLTALNAITTDADGTIRAILSTNDAYRWNSTGSAWQYVGKVKTSAFGSSPNANGYSVASDNTITLQPADATHPGGITTGAQTFAGNKDFSNNIGIPQTKALYLNGTGDSNWQVGVNIAQSTKSKISGNYTEVSVGGGAGDGWVLGVAGQPSLIEAQTDVNKVWIFGAVNASGTITFGSLNSTGIVHTDSSGNLSTSLIVNADVSASAAIAYSKLSLSNSIVNADINASAAIAYSKLALSNSIVNADINASAAIAYSKLNLSGSIVNVDINASAAIAYSKLNLSGSIVNADISNSAAIAYSKLALSGSIVNADINASAAIAYSKLNLSASIVNADVASGAAIAVNKLAALTTSRAVATDGSGFLTVSATTSTELGYVNGVTSSIQTQLDSKPNKSTGDINETSFSAANNQSAAANVTGLAFANGTVRSARVLISVYVNATSSLFEVFDLLLIQKGSSWEMSQNSAGDVSGFVFSVTNAGQVQYTNSNYSGFTAATLKFRAVTTSV